MKKSVKAVANVIAIFVVFSMLLGMVGCISPQQTADGNGGSSIDATGAWGDAVSDFQRNGLKGVWISYIEFQGVDFSTEENFTADITEMFTNAKNMGLNTVIVHARSFGDAFYKSVYFPYSHIITGTQGMDPGYDPLEIMVKTAHDTGLRIEAWVNPYRVKLYNHPQRLSADNPAQNTALTITTDSGIYYNPALQEVRDLVTEGVVEIVKNYDVDGIHFDDYFYPSTDETIDTANYAAYTGSLSLADWRRENVNRLIRQVYAAIKQVNEDVTFGISPQGNDDNNYSMQYSDVALWLREEGYCDYIMPQLYWGFDYRTKGGSDRYAFKTLSYNWSQYEKHDNVKLFIGLGAYRIGNGDGGYNDQNEWSCGNNLAKMIQVIKANPNLDGWALYSYNSLYGNSDYPQLQQAEISAITQENNG
ncbi:MAG: family 10 glycosylhydrolase [Oscillospiraceae bacterium]|nr:family 10 glycosylhydrolase [Oscillospiraceae bacterium]